MISAFSGPAFGTMTDPSLMQDTGHRPAPIRYPGFSYAGPNLSGLPHHRPDLTHSVGPRLTWRPAGLLTALIPGHLGNRGYNIIRATTTLPREARRESQGMLMLWTRKGRIVKGSIIIPSSRISPVVVITANAALSCAPERRSTT
jgi:hypothetical protein